MSVPDLEALKEQIRSAFAGVSYPGDDGLRGSDEGDEPFEVERDFRGKTDWRTLDAGFIDQAPDGLASALSFFSDAAFHFYLPAYLMADVEGRLDRADPLFNLTHGMDDSSRGERINPLRYGERTWWDAAQERFGRFTRDQAAAVAAYLRFRAGPGLDEHPEAAEALRNYWSGKAGEGAPPAG
jgi:hypothetical protein